MGTLQTAQVRCGGLCVTSPIRHHHHHHHHHNRPCGTYCLFPPDEAIGPSALSGLSILIMILLYFFFVLTEKNRAASGWFRVQSRRSPNWIWEKEKKTTEKHHGPNDGSTQETLQGAMCQPRESHTVKNSHASKSPLSVLVRGRQRRRRRRQPLKLR